MRNTIFCFFFLFCLFTTSSRLTAQNFWQSSNGPWLSINYSLFAAPNGKLYVGNDSGVYVSTDRGGQWTLLMHRVELPMITGVTVAPNGHIFGASVGHYILRSTDDGDTWTEHDQGIEHKTFHGIVADTNGYVCVGTDSGIFRSTDDGESWSEANTGVNTLIITSMTRGNNNYLYAGTTTQGVYVSSDNGATWVRSGWVTTAVYSVAVSPNGTVYAGLQGGGMYRLVSESIGWERIAYGFTKTVYGIAINSHGDVFMGTDGSSVYRSTNGGDNWDWIYTGMLYTQKVRSMTADDDDYIYAGTNGNGVYRSALPTVAVGDGEDIIPSTFVLNQNYPNPFNPFTVIRYQLSVSSWVTLKVYNVLGQEVVTLAEGIQDAGYKDAVWSAGGEPSGVYFYRLEAISTNNPGNTFVQVKKMLVVK